MSYPTYRKMKLAPYLSPAQTNTKWIKDRNMKPKTLKLPEENIGGILHDVGRGGGFLNRIPLV